MVSWGHRNVVLNMILPVIFIIILPDKTNIFLKNFIRNKIEIDPMILKKI